MRSLVVGYDELRVRIAPRERNSYRVHASTRSADASASFELPFSELEIENFILKASRTRGRRRIDNSGLGAARRFGGGLFNALFQGEVRGLYRDAVAHARHQDRGVRITLCLSESPELIDVPWEYMFDDPDFLAVSAFTPIVRYLDLPRAHRPLLVDPPLRLLGIVSSPNEAYEQLDVERERRNLEIALSRLREMGAVELHWLEQATLGALLRALQAETFHGLHYIGHGAYDEDSERGVLLFEDDSGWASPVSGDKLGMVLHDFSSLRLAVLNACEGARTGRSDPFAGVAGALVQRDIPAVVAMQFEISDEAAISFAGGFYRPLAAGFPVDASLAAARLAMLADRSDDIEWGTPVLFMRVPDGRLFDLREQRDPAEAAPIAETDGASVAVSGTLAENGTAKAEPELSVAGPSRAGRLGNQTPRERLGRPARIRSRPTRTGRRGRQRLVVAVAVAVVVLVVVVVVVTTRSAGGGSSPPDRPSLTASAPPFTIAYAKPWQATGSPVPGIIGCQRQWFSPTDRRRCDARCWEAGGISPDPRGSAARARWSLRAPPDLGQRADRRTCRTRIHVVHVHRTPHRIRSADVHERRGHHLPGASLSSGRAAILWQSGAESARILDAGRRART